MDSRKKFTEIVWTVAQMVLQASGFGIAVFAIMRVIATDRPLWMGMICCLVGAFWIDQLDKTSYQLWMARRSR